MKILTVDFTKRLPDVHATPLGYNMYGRFAEIRTGWWFGYENSSHPHTANGYYWAIRNDKLFISPRGCTLDWTKPITDDTIKWLLKKIGISGYTHFKKINDD